MEITKHDQEPAGLNHTHHVWFCPKHRWESRVFAVLWRKSRTHICVALATMGLLLVGNVHAEEAGFLQSQFGLWDAASIAANEHPSGGLHLKEVAGLAIGPQNQQARGDSQRNGGNVEPQRIVNEPPLKTRLFLALVALLGQFGLSFMGWKDIDNNRRLRGFLFLGAGGCLGALGLGLFVLTALRNTWGWFL